MSMLTLREQGQTPEILGLSAPGSSLPSSTYFAYAHRVSMRALSPLRFTLIDSIKCYETFISFDAVSLVRALVRSRFIELVG